uniref:Gamma-tubulin complex component n=2 Tax=Lutzomyia longipalpis TaxID=7200 RepID=A0A1B0CCZ4_LUTLO
MQNKMMDEQMKVIDEILPKLIKSLTGFSEKDRNFKLCRDFARSRINASDSDDSSISMLKRRILGISERLEVENLAHFSKLLENSVCKLVTQSNGEEYRESHIHWKLLDFLLALSKNPLNGARRMLREGSHVVQQVCAAEEILSGENGERVEDVLPPDLNGDDTDELSDWTESEDEALPVEHSMHPAAKMFLRYLPGDSPAHHRKTPGEASDSDDSETSSSASLSEDRVPFSLLHCPIREVIWMFFHPDNCNFYRIEEDTVKIRQDAEMPNIIVFRKFMADFAQPMTAILRIRTFCKRVLSAEGSPPQMYFIYAEALRDLLRPMEEYLLDVEKRITPEIMNEPATLLNFCHALEPHCQMLKHLLKIHESAVVEWKYFPRHICSAFLQAKIFHIIQSGLNRVEVNVAASLFTGIAQFYLQVIHSWWSFGKISDEQKEFIVSGRSAEGGLIFRSFNLDRGAKTTPKEKEMNDLLEQCPILALLKGHSNQIEERLDAINALDRAGSTRMMTTNSLWQDFLAKFTTAIEDYLAPLQESSEESSQSSSSYVNFRQGTLEKGGKLFLQLFQKSTSKPSEHSTVVSVLQNLMDRSKGMLPLEGIFRNALNETLNTEIQASDKLMVEIYSKELNLLEHLRLIRRVFLLEDSATMFTFYSRLFEDMESRQEGIHPLSLTINLQNTLSAVYPESHSKFRLELASLHNTKTGSALQIIRQLSLIYKLSPNIAKVFDEASMRSYNRLFGFLLSIKWSLWTLEGLKFTKSFSIGSAYGSLTETVRTSRRLAIIRFWILYALNNIHFHLMSEALQRLGHEVEQRIGAAESLQEIIHAHSDYLNTLLEHCFLLTDGEKLLTGINQLFHLVQVVRSEWVAVDKECVSDDENAFDIESQIDQIEKTYVECHRFLATTLSKEVAINGKTYLSALVSAFDRRLPY